MILQVRTRATRATVVMNRAPFSRGFKDARKGKPFDPDAYLKAKEQWDYERGRQLGFIFDGPLKVGKKLNMGAAVVFVDAINQKEII